jgi:hypothetical protein
MAKTEQNLKATEDFIRGVLATNFNQKIKEDALRKAAEQLCDAMPTRRKVAA